MQPKGFFFDTEKVRLAMDEAERRAQSKTAGYTRRVAKNSIKYSTPTKHTSAAGQPPLAHRSTGFRRTKKNRKTGSVSQQASSPLKELIFYGYDLETKSTVIGPALFRQAQDPGVAPRRLEFGLDGYKKHPFMAPALAKTGNMLTDAIRKSLR